MEDKNSESRQRKKKEESDDDDYDDDEDELQQQRQETENRLRSSCQRYEKKKRRQKLNHYSQEKEATALHEKQPAVPVIFQLRPLSKCNPLNPLFYLLDRQIDYKANYSKRLINARFSNSENLFRKDLYAHYGCINAIEFSPEGDFLISGE